MNGFEAKLRDTRRLLLRQLRWQLHPDSVWFPSDAAMRFRVRKESRIFMGRVLRSTPFRTVAEFEQAHYYKLRHLVNLMNAIRRDVQTPIGRKKNKELRRKYLSGQDEVVKAAAILRRLQNGS